MQSRSNYFPAAGALYLCFVIYGSLVPLEFRALPMGEATRRFAEMPYLHLGIGSLADWVANILLFIPLSFIWLGVVWRRFNAVAQVLSSVLVVALCASLAVGIEFTQVFFPPRTVSLNDVMAETLGSAIGVLAWWMFGEQFSFWLRQWRERNGQAGFGLKLLQAYLAFLFFYNVMPLDLTISPVELYHKWHEGRIILLPFGAHFSDLYQWSYNLFVDAIIWTPVAFLLVWSGKKPPQAAIAWSIACALILELFQLFVYSRVTDVSDILLALPGAALGAWVATRGGPVFGKARENTGVVYSSLPPMAAAGFVLWCMVLAGVFWYPFDFRFAGGTFGDRLESMHWVPFYAYYYGSEFRALTEVFHKVLFFLPLGAISRIFVGSLRHSAQARLIEYGAFSLIVLSAFGIELGQMFLPGKNADMTDFIMEAASGLIGYQGLQMIQAEIGAMDASATQTPLHSASTRNPSSARPPQEWQGAASFRKLLNAIINHPRGVATPKHRLASGAPGMPHNNKTWLPLFAGIILLAMAAWLAVHSPAVPYNIRELLNPSYPLLAVLVLSTCVFWTLGFPVAIAYWLSKPGARVQLYPLTLIFHGVIALVMVGIFAPLESIHDIVGSPVLGWPWHWEIAGRFLALFSAVSLTMTCGTFAVMAGVYKRGAARGFAALTMASVALYPVFYWIVVAEAATDNLTELMAGGGTLASAALLAGFLALLLTSGSWLATRIHLGMAGRSWPGVAWIIVSYPAAYMLVSYGTEEAIVKYGQVFSALQFLLSPDRSNYLHGWALLKRYLILHSAVIVAVMLVQYSVMARLPLVPRGHRLQS